MCARFSLFASPEAMLDLFGLDEPPEWEPAYNIAPTDEVLGIVAANVGRKARRFRWGLRPSDKAPLLINARAEGVDRTPAFREAFSERRCLIAASGFFEWRAEGSRKQPYLFARTDRTPFAFAGLWAPGNPNTGGRDSCAILTTEPNALMAPIHDRMPVILAPQEFDAWLDLRYGRADLAALLGPPDDEGWEAVPVTPKMGRTTYKEPDAVEPVAAQRSLDF